MLSTPQVKSRNKVLAACAVCAVSACAAMTIVIREPALLQPARWMIFAAGIGVAFQVFGFGRSLGYDWSAGATSRRLEAVLRCGVMALLLAFVSVWAGGVAFFFLQRLLES